MAERWGDLVQRDRGHCDDLLDRRHIEHAQHLQQTRSVQNLHHGYDGCCCCCFGDWFTTCMSTNSPRRCKSLRLIGTRSPGSKTPRNPGTSSPRQLTAVSHRGLLPDNDIDWGKAGYKETCLSNSSEVAAYAKKKISQGHGSFLGPGTEEKWVATAELLCRIITSFHQVIVYGAVSDWCDELAQQIPDHSSRTGRLAAELNDESETRMCTQFLCQS